MTWEDALEIKQNWTPIQARNDLERLIITGERPADKVVGLACKALDMQIPKRIEQQTEEDREFIDYVCPNCKTTLQQKMKGATRTTIYKYKHCIFCGQSLDWSDHPTEKGGAE
ncbi:MAG: hypothetical protein IJ949_01450 [Oscillospiraceae bacterium]|nr:hypothetical protein [Oscillospiraceae bacterium]